ncbi:hypothetical protein BG015_004115 [Linnemannia schmuckeri]|uniref:Uncharacterized protein n=1 Tax=Linnemannia schmuckeri TaxID=64567 RepID=A0A9P5RFY8_9FUNG|nr:hypothetical protein BG015_004115 [Linnemannia schmuckeri]
MSTSFPLPLECLQLILRQFRARGEVWTLVRILQVNKYLCSATLPFLYNDPLLLARYRVSRDPAKQLAALLKVIKVLLLSIPEGNVSPLLRAAYFQDLTDSETLPPSSFPYYAFVTKIDFQLKFPLYQRIFHGADPNLTDYLNRYGHTSRYLSEEIFIGHKYGTSEIVTQAATLELHRDMTRALCENAERVKALAIPISDVTRYLSMVQRFKVLSSITFELDRIIIPFGNLDREATPEEQKFMEKQRKERCQHLEEMISFVREHQRCHPNVLKSALCRKGKLTDLDCPEEYQFRLAQYLPPIYKPRSLTNRNWAQFIANVHDTDLSFVTAIHPLPGSSREIFMERLLAAGPFLHRCRSLESFEIHSLGDDSFQWAVDERNQYNADIAAGRLPQRPLVPLRNFIVKYDHPSKGRQINDVVFAFNDTLRCISIESYWTQDFDLHSEDDDELSTFRMGDNDVIWDLPRLSSLSVEINELHLYIHPDVLSRCPSLVNVILSDARRQEYILNEVVYWKPAELSGLKTLELVGSPAIPFHPDTLKSTRKLLRLKLGTRLDTGNAFIPPPEDFIYVETGKPSDIELDDPSSATVSTISRPIWTWDWDLPCLTELCLNAEFGYRFQFRMLANTPSLTYMTINIKSWSGQHKRTVQLADLQKPGSAHPLQGPPDGLAPIRGAQEVGGDVGMEADLEGTLQQPKYIHLPALKNLSLIGRWTLSGQVLVTIFSKMAPNLTQANMNGCDGFSLAEWVDATSSHLHDLKTSSATITTADRIKLAEVGLIPASSLPYSIDYYFLVKRPKGRVSEVPAAYLLPRQV